MADSQSNVRQNYFAILVAAVVCFLFEMGWYSFFLQSWLSGIGRTSQWLTSTGVNPAIQFAAALVAEARHGSGHLPRNSAHRRTDSAARDQGRGAVWLGFVFPVFSAEYVFEVRPWSLLGINAGFWLGGMILMGAIVGGWKKK